VLISANMRLANQPTAHQGYPQISLYIPLLDCRL
jgi:hypothetical protein